MKRFEAEEMADRALAFLANRPEDLHRFLTVSGLDGATLLERADDSLVRAAILGFVAGDESLAKTFSEDAELKQGALIRACATLDPHGIQRMVTLDHARPLIICDADEVLLQFTAGLEKFLERNECYLDLKSFRIHGNVKHRESNEAISDETVSNLLKAFFESETRTMEMVPGAADALRTLNARAQIVVLSNLPETSREARIQNLTGHGMPYPVIAGKGLKGEIVKRMIEGFAPPVVFIDDLPPHLASVAAETPHVHRLHFIADPRLARLLPAAPEAHRRIDDWPTAAEWIASVIEAK